jgi:outer membrane biosynthesis protein TonB
MARLARTSIVAALGALAAAALYACGGEDAKLLPGETAREITANLESVQQLSDEGDCIGAEGAAQQVSEQVEALGGVDRKLKEALSDGADRLMEVVDECEEEEPEELAPTEVPTTQEDEQRADEEAEKREEKEQEKAEKEREKEEREEEKAPLPPEGEKPGKGPPETSPPTTPPGHEETSSGGVEPGSPVGGEEGEE